MNWGLRVKKLMDERDWRQSDLVERSGLSNSHVSKILKGVYKDSTNDTRVKLAQAFNMSMAEFLEKVYPDNGTKVTVQGDKTPLTDDQLFAILKRRFAVTDMVEIPLIGSVPDGNPFLAPPSTPSLVPMARVLLEGVNMDGVVALRVKGNSYVNEGLADQEILIVETKYNFTDGGLYFVEVDGKVILRRAFREDGHLVLTNKSDYRKVPADSAVIKGRVHMIVNWRKP